jgi:predicted DCC family thiol-disulfide oxidoreductase YuxK
MEKHWVFYDGDCGMCSRYAEGLKKADKTSVFHVIAYQDAPSPPMTDELRKRCERALHVSTANGTILGGANAVLFIKSKTGWGWFASLLRLPPIIWIAELLYKLVANNRYIFSKWLYRK